jgi:hypothetical protein
MTDIVTDPFTYDRFLPLVGEVFRFVVNDREELQVLLSEVARLVRDETWRGRQRDPFSLIFHGPRDVLAPQGTYRVESANTDSFEAFVVPIGPDQVGMRYEIIFT